MATDSPSVDRGPISAAAHADNLARQLTAAANDDTLRERAARAFLVAGDPVRSLELLERYVRLNAHDVSPLPCFCRRCMVPARDEAVADKVAFIRDFALAEGRVLHFWLPATLAGERRRVAGSVASSMRSRFRAGAR